MNRSTAHSEVQPPVCWLSSHQSAPSGSLSPPEQHGGDWGGWWERLVRTVTVLRKTLGKSVLSKVELETLLLEVEACVNSRSLTFVSDDVDGSQPLTPSHFLSGKAAGVRVPVVDDSAEVSASSLTEREEQRQNLLAQFWNV